MTTSDESDKDKDLDFAQFLVIFNEIAERLHTIRRILSYDDRDCAILAVSMNGHIVTMTDSTNKESVESLVAIINKTAVQAWERARKEKEPPAPTHSVSPNVH